MNKGSEKKIPCSPGGLYENWCEPCRQPLPPYGSIHVPSGSKTPKIGVSVEGSEHWVTGVFAGCAGVLVPDAWGSLRSGHRGQTVSGHPATWGSNWGKGGLVLFVAIGAVLKHRDSVRSHLPSGGEDGVKCFSCRAESSHFLFNLISLKEGDGVDCMLHGEEHEGQQIRATPAFWGGGGKCESDPRRHSVSHRVPVVPAAAGVHVNKYKTELARAAELQGTEGSTPISCAPRTPSFLFFSTKLCENLINHTEKGTGLSPIAIGCRLPS